MNERTGRTAGPLEVHMGSRLYSLEAITADDVAAFHRRLEAEAGPSPAPYEVYLFAAILLAMAKLLQAASRRRCRAVKDTQKRTLG